jgi:DNA-binding transcriptional regulator YiaG
MTPEQCRAARGWLGWSQNELAGAAHVSHSTVKDFEAGKRVPIANNLAAMRVALESRGIGFVGDDKSATCGVTYTEPKTA